MNVLRDHKYVNYFGMLSLIDWMQIYYKNNIIYYKSNSYLLKIVLYVSNHKVWNLKFALMKKKEKMKLLVISVYLSLVF